MSDSPAAPPAVTIGRYRVLGAIGSGAMGSVVRAHDDRLGRDVAIKRIRNLHGALAAAFHARFEAEARALAALAHPGVVQIFDLGIDGDDPYLVMELLAGPSLRDELRTRGPLPATEVAAIGIQLARALEAAHDRGILHRDVKPGNVVRAADGRWKLVDFGVAHVPDSDVTITGQFVGTPAYAAPEALALGQFAAASDVYGLAATLLEIATGAPPRGDLSMTGLLTATGPVLDDAAIARLGPLGPPLAAALAVTPGARPSAAALAEALAAASAGLAAPYPGAPPAIAASAPPPLPPAPAASTSPPSYGSIPAASSAALATAALPEPPAAPSSLRRWALLATGAVLAIGLLALADRLGGGDAPRRLPSREDRYPPPDLPMVFDPPPGLDGKGARDWAKIADKVHDGDLGEALHKLHDFERKHGASPESAALRTWLAARADR